MSTSDHSRATSAPYTLLNEDQWPSIRRDIAIEAPDDVYWTVRAFGLEGQVTFHLGATTFVWGGFLLDLACALADWLDRLPQTFTFLPVEQANNVSIDVVDGDVILRSGLLVTSVPFGAATEGFRAFLGQLGDAAIQEAPELAEVPGFEWLVRHRPQTGHG